MKLPKHVISIYKRSTGEHVLEAYNAETPIIAAYIVASNNFDIIFDDNEDRADSDWEEVEQEFKDYGYSVAALTV
jgi:hypothetical protein